MLDFMRNIRAKMREENGVALIMTMILLVVVGVLAAAFLTTSQGTTSVAFRQLDQKRAFWAAEAGVEHISSLVGVLEEVEEGSNFDVVGWPEGKVDFGEDYDGSYDIDIDSPSNVGLDLDDGKIIVEEGFEGGAATFEFESRGDYNGASQIITRKLNIDIVGGEGDGELVMVNDDNDVKFLTEDDLQGDPGDVIDNLMDFDGPDHDFNGDLFGVTWDPEEGIVVLGGDQSGGSNLINFDSEGIWNDDYVDPGQGSNHLREMHKMNIDGEERLIGINHNGRIFKKKLGENEEWVKIENANLDASNWDNMRAGAGEETLKLVEYEDFDPDGFHNSVLHSVKFENDNGEIKAKEKEEENLFHQVTDVAYGNGEFVVVGGDWNDETKIYRKEEGGSWSSDFNGIGEDLHAVTWDPVDETFVATGAYDKIYKFDPENEEWNDLEMDSDTVTNRHQRDVFAFGDTIITVAGYHGGSAITVSTDGGDSWLREEGEDVPNINMLEGIKGFADGGGESEIDVVGFSDWSVK